MRNLFILSILLTSTLALAQHENCDHPHPELNDILNISKKIEWAAATETNIKSAHCLRKIPFTEVEMSKWVEANQSAEKTSKKINGIHFEGESPEKLKSFELLTSAVDFFGKPDKKRQKNFSSKCKKVQCAVTEIFGASAGSQLLYMHQKYGMNGSHLAYENTSSWKSSELDSILIALSDFPSGILPIETNRKLVRFSRGYVRNGDSGNVIANSVIEIFDPWNAQSPEMKRYTLTHELGHAIAGVTGLDDNPKWLKLSGWEIVTKVKDGKTIKVPKLTKPNTVISKYGLTNNWEDLAESVSAYRYNPAALKKVSPEKYAFIKQFIFDDVEYTSKEACENPTRLSQSLINKAQVVLNSWKPTPIDLVSISNKCSSLAIKKLSEKGSVNLNDADINKCYEKEVANVSAELAMKSVNNHPDKALLAPLLRNLKLKPITPEKIKSFSNQARITHQKTLKSELTNSFKRDNYFREGTKNFQYSYQSVSGGLGVDPFVMRDDFTKIFAKAAVQIDNNGSLRRWINLDYSNSEITDQVNAMIK